MVGVGRERAAGSAQARRDGYGERVRAVSLGHARDPASFDAKVPPPASLLHSRRVMALTIEVQKIPIRLVDVGGQASEAHLFLHLDSSQDFRSETVGERLNNPEVDFLPFEIDGRTVLISLTSLGYAEVLETPPELARMEEIGASRESVTLILQSGESLRGELVFEAAPGRTRVLDLLNAGQQRFLLLQAADKTLFVRRNAIVRVEV